MSFYILLFVTLGLLLSCEKNSSENNTKPTITLKSGSSYVSKDTAIAAGSQITIGIQVSSTGGENLTNLVVKSNDTLKLLDYGFNAEVLEKDVVIIKNIVQTEIIKCIIRIAKGISDSISLILTKKGVAYGQITTYQSVTLGGQSNSTNGSNVSLQNGQVYLQADAFVNQALIDILYYVNIAD